MDTDLRQENLSSFLEIAVGQSSDAATQFLEATSWNLEEALQLFFTSNETGTAHNTTANNSRHQDYNSDDVRPPLAVRREALYEDEDYFYDEDNYCNREVWESNNGSSDRLTSMYTRPHHLMYQGTFEKAKQEGSVKNKWLLVNLQSEMEFSSHMLNRDTWSNEALAQIIKSNFVFWQEYNDTVEGQKVCTFYKLAAAPVILVIDPITGQRMRSLTGMIEPDFLMNELVQFVERSPKDYLVAVRLKHPRHNTHRVEAAEDNKEDEKNLLVASADSTENVSSSSCEGEEADEKELVALVDSMENMSTSSCEVEDVKVDEEPKSSTMNLTYPELPEEPKGLDRKLVCRVGVRLPDSRRVQRSFRRTDTIQLLWSFCKSQLEEGEVRCFHLAHVIPGASVTLDYESNLTFEESGLANSLVSVIMVD